MVQSFSEEHVFTRRCRQRRLDDTNTPIRSIVFNCNVTVIQLSIFNPCYRYIKRSHFQPFAASFTTLYIRPSKQANKQIHYRMLCKRKTRTGHAFVSHVPHRIRIMLQQRSNTSTNLRHHDQTVQDFMLEQEGKPQALSKNIKQEDRETLPRQEDQQAAYNEEQ
ncbi:hypothetical protein N658DRAFT_491850 [Parathielavia hyrcaniae]|uniref:Uncharacterized protein n=1 Tax=Parathielavia hyrcaniae TaxID=113614 RepID=A0AAN6QDA3_9PEZI|nr:hypothetical protein N658DRAFT_491850 [Parathielavia hyrcaniae]